MSERTYTVLSFFCGSGGKTLGAQRARISLLGVDIGAMTLSNGAVWVGPDAEGRGA